MAATMTDDAEAEGSVPPVAALGGLLEVAEDRERGRRAA
jgi:hypothetical protein